MAKAFPTWTVLGHGPIEKLADNLWRVEAALPNGPLKRVLVVARRSDGGLVIHNPVALRDADMAALEAWGAPRTILVPNGYHRLDAPTFSARYPSAQVLCPRGSRARVEEVVPVAGTYDDFAADDAISLRTFAGAPAEGAMIVRSSDGVSVVLNDVVFNMPHAPGFPGFVLKMLSSSGGPRVSRIARMLLVKDKAKLRAELEELASIPGLRRVIVSHHETIADDPAGALRAVAASL